MVEIPDGLLHEEPGYISAVDVVLEDERHDPPAPLLRVEWKSMDEGGGWTTQGAWFELRADLVAGLIDIFDAGCLALVANQKARALRAGPPLGAGPPILGFRAGKTGRAWVCCTVEERASLGLTAPPPPWWRPEFRDSVALAAAAHEGASAAEALAGLEAHHRRIVEGYTKLAERTVETLSVVASPPSPPPELDPEDAPQPHRRMFDDGDTLEVSRRSGASWKGNPEAGKDPEHVRLFLMSEDGMVRIEDCQVTSDNPRAERVRDTAFRSVSLTCSEARWLLHNLPEVLAHAEPR